MFIRFKDSQRYWLLTAFLCTLTFSMHAQIAPTSANDRMRGDERRLQLDQQSPFRSLGFRNIGPTQMNGRVADLEVNPDDPTEFYLAYASGGLWHTKNNGLSFTPIFERQAVMTIGDIAVNWKQRHIWIGTGEVNSSRSSYAGNGVYFSRNNGASWQYLGLPESHHIGKVQLHPTDTLTAWVAAMGHLYTNNKERGVFLTRDGGKSWTHSLAIDDSTGVIEMEADPFYPTHLYAASWTRNRKAWNFEGTGATSGIYESLDGGKNWVRISHAGSGFPVGTKVGRIGIAVSAAQRGLVYAVVDHHAPYVDTTTKKQDTTKYSIDDLKGLTAEQFRNLSTAKLDTFLKKNGFPTTHPADTLKALVARGAQKPTVVYDWLIAEDGFQNTDIHGAEVYRSEDGGKTWRKTNLKKIDIYHSYGYYFGKIYASPTNPNKLVIMGTELLVSTDGGKTFTETDKDNTHADWHCFWFNPKKDSHWIAGNDGGCNITYDDGAKWFMVNSIPAGQFYAITTDNAKPYNVYGGLQDNGTWYGPSRINTRNKDEQPEPEQYPWKMINGGDGMQVQVDTRNNQTVFTGYQFGFYSRKSLNGGKSVSIHPMHDIGEAKLRYNWQTPILLSKHQQDVFYFGSNKIHRSLNQGETLEALSGDLTRGKRIGNIPYGTLSSISESPKRFGLLYVGTDDGLVHISKDAGYTWTNISKGLPANLWVSRVIASRHREGRVWVSLNGYRFDHFTAYVYLSEDYGQTWKQVSNGLPQEPVNVVREDIKHADALYVGTDHGLYVSFNLGQQWHTLGASIPRVAVHDLAIQERDRDLVVGTHGRSIYITSLDSVYKIYDSVQRMQTRAHWSPRQQSELAKQDVQLHEGANLPCPPLQPKRKTKKPAQPIPGMPSNDMSYSEFKAREAMAAQNPRTVDK
jgi:photosystem II stability/assembly factor-like uncharacterized protein